MITVVTLQVEIETADLDNVAAIIETFEHMHDESCDLTAWDREQIKSIKRVNVEVL